jgi:DNA-directed RNA polymerase specialized sigma24 family protein
VGLTETRDAQFRDFVSARSAALLRVAYLVCGDLNLAEDLLQTTLTHTYLAWRRLDGIDSLEAYSRRVLLNTATSWWRRRWRGERTSAAECEGNEPMAFEDSAHVLIWSSTGQQMLRCDIRTGASTALTVSPLDPADERLVPRYGF